MSIKTTRKAKKHVVSSLLLVSSIVILSGCSLFDRSDVRTSSGVVTEKSVNSLDEASYYVKYKKTFGKLYLGDRTFKNSSNVSSRGQGNPDRVIWLKDDYKNIPVMHRGDKIVYHSKEKLVTTFNIERYYDLGYSIGIAKLREDNDSGRFSLPMSESSLSIDPKSDAKKLQSISTHDDIVIDSIGDTPLRAGNVSVSGTIIGLEKDKTYAVNAYLGTNLYQKNIKADTLVLSSSESDRIIDFEFSKSKTVEFEFPKYYNSGYYLVNGFGLVRYLVEDDEGKKEVDMNIPNVYPKDDEEGEDVAQKEINAEDLTSANIEVKTDGEQIITISYDQMDGLGTDGKGFATPKAKLISPDGAISFEDGKGDTLTLSTTLDKGEYEVQIIGLNGRTYSYRVKSASDKEESKDDSSDSSEKSTTEEATNDSKSETSESKSMADIVNGN